MSIASVSNTPALAQAAAVSHPTPAPPPAKDKDGDSDNGAPDVRASTPPGVGEKVDLKV